MKTFINNNLVIKAYTSTGEDRKEKNNLHRKVKNNVRRSKKRENGYKI